MDSCWKHSELKDKQTIINELITGEKELSGNHYGKFVMRNCNIEYYKKRGSLKEGGYTSKEKVKKLFADIVDTSSSTKMKSRQKRKLRTDPPEMSDRDGEQTIGCTVKKKKLFEDEVSIYEYNKILLCYFYSLTKKEEMQ